MRHEGIFDQIEVYVLDNILHECGYVPHHALLVDIALDIHE